MKSFLTVYALFMGICIGSFLNVLIYRMPLGLNVAKGRSFCPTCKHKLGAIDLVPLFSYLFLGGKCRYCETKISPRYFIIELITGILYSLTVYLCYPSYRIFLYLIIISILIVISLIDYEKKYIPPVLTLIIAISSLIYVALFDFHNILLYMISVFIVSSPFIISSIIAFYMGKKSFGMGDLKLLLALGISIPLNFSLKFLSLLLISIVLKYSMLFLGNIIMKKSIFFNLNKSIAFADVISAAYMAYILIYCV